MNFERNKILQIEQITCFITHKNFQFISNIIDVSAQVQQLKCYDLLVNKIVSNT